MITVTMVFHYLFFSVSGEVLMSRTTFLTKIRGRTAQKLIVGALFIAIMIAAQSGLSLWARGGGGFRTTVPQRIDYPAESLKDGIYEGTATGYQPNLKVRVEVKNGRIAAISVTQSYETPRWWNAVVDVMPKRIQKSQSTDIDVVSGATASSYGIMAAVEDALSKAVSSR
jgi:uncharacterized protein with FMN-binding domain